MNPPPPATPVSRTAQLGHTFGQHLSQTAARTINAVAQRRWKQTRIHTLTLREQADLLRVCVVRDALDAGLNWWQVGEHLHLHPQDAWELFGGTTEGHSAPAEQQPALALRLCAGIDLVHAFHPGYGADLDSLPHGHSLHFDPTVAQLHDAAALLRTDIWIAVDLAAEAVPLPETADVAHLWSSVAAGPSEIAEIRHARAEDRSCHHCRCTAAHDNHTPADQWRLTDSC